ncbi:mannosyltransferase family protein [Streptomyces sp. NPDC005760]|uniref:mannosyltransferase family protein n=1 Tax=Streptomyces sp. NPDC005760 TaxID=3156718 RepID=UPI0033F89F2B
MTDLGTRTEPALRRAAPALLGYAAVRALGLLTLALWSAARDKNAYTLLTARWDALWYTRVAELGYSYEVRLPNGDVHSNLAFFPLLPWLERLLSAVTPLSYADAGFAISLLASLAAAWGVFAVADHVYGRRAGVCAVLLWAVLPVGIVQSMAYSESLFTALAAWSLYAVLTGRWVTAGLLASLAGLTRPVGLAVVAAVWAAGITAFVRDRQPREGFGGVTEHTGPVERRDTASAAVPAERRDTASAAVPAQDPGNTAAQETAPPRRAPDPHGATRAVRDPSTRDAGSSVRDETAAGTGDAHAAEPAPGAGPLSTAGHPPDVGGTPGRPPSSHPDAAPARAHSANADNPPAPTPTPAPAPRPLSTAGHPPDIGGTPGPPRSPHPDAAPARAQPPGAGSLAAPTPARHIRTRRALGMALAPLGAAAYVLWVGRRTGKGPFGYLDVQAGWRNGFDGGYAFARFVADKFTSFPSALAGVGLIVGVGLVVWLYVTCVRQGQPLSLLVYAGVVTALALCASSYFGSKPRLLMPAFPLLLPLALTLARASTRRSALILASIATASALYGAFWLNGSGPP